jgi:hypothetical protein
VKVVKIYGGLGNQMFQYAFARALAARTGDEVYLDSSALDSDAVHNGYELGRVFGVGLPEAPRAAVDRLSDRPTSLLGRLRRKYFTKATHFIDRKFAFQGELFDLPGDRYFDGYWQSEKYFKDIEEDLRREFAFKLPLSSRNQELLRELPRPIASLHVRRGDYLKYPELDICGPEYYEKAVTETTARGGAASFMLLSDDMEYCKKTIDLGKLPAVYVDWNGGADAWQDMALMASCDSHIIANSSFSWWGAWLDPNPRKLVVAPSVWNRRQLGSKDRYYRFSFDDVVPEAWLRVGLTGGARA